LHQSLAAAPAGPGKAAPLSRLLLRGLLPPGALSRSTRLLGSPSFLGHDASSVQRFRRGFEFVVPKLRDQPQSRHNNKKTIPILGLVCRAASLRCCKRHASRKYLYAFRKFVQHDFAKSSCIESARQEQFARSSACARTMPPRLTAQLHSELSCARTVRRDCLCSLVHCRSIAARLRVCDLLLAHRPCNGAVRSRRCAHRANMRFSAGITQNFCPESLAWSRRVAIASAACAPTNQGPQRSTQK
jgi:hypothetical protein